MRTNKKILFLVLLSVLFISQSCTSTIVGVFRFIERFKAGLSEKSVQAANHKIVYLQGGEGETVLLLHGFGADKDNWTKFSGYLTKKYNVVIPDLPGFGNSDKFLTEKYDIESQMTRLREFTQKLGLKKIHIAGNSMGGLYSGLYAARYPDEILTLCLFNAGGITDREKSGMVTEMEKGINPLIVEKPSDFDRLMNFVFVNPPSIPDSLKKYLAEKAVRASTFNKKVFFEALPGDRLEKKLKYIKARTLVIWGDQDRIFPSSSAAVIGKMLKNSKVVVIKNCGHMPMVEKADESARYYLELIKQ